MVDNCFAYDITAFTNCQVLSSRLASYWLTSIRCYVLPLAPPPFLRHTMPQKGMHSKTNDLQDLMKCSVSIAFSMSGHVSPFPISQARISAREE